MKYMGKKLASIIAMLLVLYMFAPVTFPIINNIYVAEAATVKLNKNVITINVGEAYQLKLIGTNFKVTWSSSKKSVAIVSSKGLVTGIKAGTIKVSAKVGGNSYECTVNVVTPILSCGKSGQGIGSKTQWKINNLPKEFTIDDILWKSSNEDIITIDGNGLATTVGIGKCKISATFGKYKLSQTITIWATKDDLLNAVNNFKVEYAQIKNEIVCVILNNGKIDISASCHLEFYDSNDRLVSISNDNYINIFKGNEGIVVFVLPEKDYDHYKLKFEKCNQNSSQINQKDKVTVSLSDKYDYTYQYTDWENYSYNYEITETIKLFDININNQSGKRVYFDLSLLYYKDNKLIDYQRIPNYFDLDVGVTVIEKPQIKYIGNDKITISEFDSCRIIYSATTNRY